MQSVDLLVGGFPCQDLSVAGRRAGLGGERSGLFFEFARVADVVLKPGGWVLIENVPGLLSSEGGRDFAVLLATLADLGFHDLAWRVLDSRFFGVPQRRRRVFILGRRARGRRAAEVLLEPKGGEGNPAPGREAGQDVAATLSRGSSAPGVSAPGRRQEDDENLVAYTLRRDPGGTGQGHNTTYVSALDTRRGGPDDNDAQAGHLVAGTVRSHVRPGSNDSGGIIAPALVKRYGNGTDSDATDALIAHSLTAEGFDASEDGTGRGTPLVPDGVRAAPGLPGRMDGVRSDTCAYDPAPDGPRYAQMGNAVTVSVAEWIGRRLMDQAP